MLWIWRGAKPRTLSEDFKDCVHFNMSVLEPLLGYPGHLGNLVTFYKIFPRNVSGGVNPTSVCVCVCALAVRFFSASMQVCSSGQCWQPPVVDKTC